MLDGNKRTSYVICGIFLKRKGQNLHASEEETTAVIMVLANNALTEEHFAQWLQSNVPSSFSLGTSNALSSNPSISCRVFPAIP